MSTHTLCGQWITDDAFAALCPRNVFHRQLQPLELPADPNANSHVLFRRGFALQTLPRQAIIRISADDYYKLYINGSFVCQGPAPGYHFAYNYNEVDVTAYLQPGANTVAVHTYYQGLINRVWVSGDFRHGLLLDMLCDGELLLCSDESWRTHRHTGYTALGKAGYDTAFLERYDCRAPERDFAAPDFDDSGWPFAKLRQHADYRLADTPAPLLVFEKIRPVRTEYTDSGILLDFGSMYVGSLAGTAKGKEGQVLTLYAGQELNVDGSVRHAIRANCDYTEEWVLSGRVDALQQFDYKAFRYVFIGCAPGVKFSDLHLLARHAPFELKRQLKPALAGNIQARRIWNLCVHSLRCGVQETVQDCMDREKGFYLGDGCYSALAHCLLTGNDAMVRKLIDDAFATSFITPGLVTCMDCAFMQEIAEYPLILPQLMLWHYRLCKDADYLKASLPKMTAVLEHYRAAYETGGLLRDLDRWCVVEWPANYRDGYAVDIREGQVCHEAHIAVNAYYYNAVRTVNRLCELLGLPAYRDEAPLRNAIVRTFYDPAAHLFCDGEEHRHTSLAGNVFPWAFDLAPDSAFDGAFRALLAEKGEDQLFLFTVWPVLFKLTANGETDAVHRILLHEGTWSRMLREGATATFEGWGRECKWNTSLFHLTMSAAAIFMADIDLKELLW